MLNLTRQQQTVICVVIFLLITGWLVKTFRLKSLPPQPVSSSVL